MISPKSAKLVLEILENESHSLKTLAFLSGYDPFSFYQSADLTGLDLQDQDLTGLNFDLADLRGCNIDRISYDKGAFNNALLSENSSVEKDDFELHFSDLIDEDVKRLYLFISIREGFIDAMKSALRVNYQELSEICKLSSATLRKARRGEAIMIESGQAIARAIAGERAKENLNPSQSTLRQPAVSVLRIKYTGGFAVVSRSNFFRYLDIAKKMYALRKSRESTTYLESWRDGPSLLDWYFKSYFQKDEAIGSLYLAVRDDLEESEGAPRLL